MKAALSMLKKAVKINSTKKATSAASNNPEVNKKILLSLLPGVAGVLIPLILTIIIVLGPIMLAQQFIEDVKSEVGLFFEKVGNVLTFDGWCAESDGSCEKKAEQKYYEELNEVYEDYKDDGVEIDVSLITGTIFYGSTIIDDENVIEEDDEDEELPRASSNNYGSYAEIHIGDIEKLADHMVSGKTIDYTKYRKYLIDTYIEKRFEDLYEDKEDKEAAKEKIADEIMLFASGKVPELAGTRYSGSCTYNVAGGTVDTKSTQVVVLTCDGKEELERVDLEKYIKGVVYGEIGNTWPDEVLKSQAVAARSFALTRNETMCPGNPSNCNYGYNSNKNEIRLRNCEADQVYCDYEKGCQKYSYNGYNSLKSGISDPNLSVYKQPLEGDAKTNFENALKEVEGLVLMGTDNKIYATSYISSVQNTWKNMFDNNSNYKYNDILIGYYGKQNNAKLVIGGNCSVASGEFENWQQGDPRWGSKSYGNATLAGVGCNFTSIIIEIAYSGVPTTLTDFNPGTAFDYMKSRGYLGVNGDTQSYAAFIELAPEFNYAGTKYFTGFTDTQVRDNLAQLIDTKNYPIIHVQSGNSLPYYTNNHWVAVIGYTSDDVIIVDPASTGCTRLFTCKPGLDRSNGYGITDQVVYWN